MLEHSDGDHAIIRAAHGAVILQFEAHPARKSGRFSARARRFQLLGGQSDAGDPRAVFLRQRDRHAAPAGTDVKHVQVRPDQAEFRRDVALLGRLRLLQRLGAVGEIRAGIVAVPIQEQRVQAAVQVVMMRHVAPGAGDRVVLAGVAQRARDGAAQGKARVTAAIGDVGEQQVEYVLQPAVQRHQVAGHERLAEHQRGVGEQAAYGVIVTNCSARHRLPARPVAGQRAVRVAHCQLTGRDEPGEDGVDQRRQSVCPVRSDACLTRLRGIRLQAACANPVKPLEIQHVCG